MCGGSILSCCPRNLHGHERALKEEEDKFMRKKYEDLGKGQTIRILGAKHGNRGSESRAPSSSQFLYFLN